MPVSLESVSGARQTLDMLVQFAYEHGFHELGYDPVAALVEAMRPAAPRADPPAPSEVASLIGWFRYIRRYSMANLQGRMFTDRGIDIILDALDAAARAPGRAQ